MIICIELIENEKIPLPFKPSSIGRWWSRKGDEIDIVASDEHKGEILFIECKWMENIDPSKVIAVSKTDSKSVHAGYR